MPHFSQADTTVAILAALLAALATFLTADLVVLPKLGNLTAILLDAIISVLVLWEISYITGASLKVPGLLLILVLLVAGEWYYHRYLTRLLFTRRPRRR